MGRERTYDSGSVGICDGVEVTGWHLENSRSQDGGYKYNNFPSNAPTKSNQIIVLSDTNRRFEQ
jgi:hypothetical protein